MWSHTKWFILVDFGSKSVWFVLPSTTLGWIQVISLHQVCLFQLLGGVNGFVKLFLSVGERV